MKGKQGIKAAAVRLGLWALVVGTAILPLEAQAQKSAEPVAFARVNLIDGVSPRVQAGVTVLVEGGKIRAILQPDQKPPETARIIDLKGYYMMPGLIDAHVHIRTFDAAKRALMSGVTTARSMGVSHFADVGLGALAKAEKIEAPEILAAGYHIRPKPADAFFMDFPDLADLMQNGVHGKKAVRRMVQAMVSRKVDWIKTNATARAGLPHTDPRQPYYTEEELKALVEEAAKHGIPVAAHAHGDQGGRAAVEAGVRSIEHGTYLSEATLRRMREKGTFLVPTIAVVSDLTMPGGDYDNPLLQIRGRHMYPRIRETAKRAFELGVKLVAATDTGYGPKSTLRLAQELEEFVALGMTPFQAVQSATTVAAELLGVQDHAGRIAPGYDADLIVMERNPLEHVGAIHDLLMVVNNGKIVLNRTVW